MQPREQLDRKTLDQLWDAWIGFLEGRGLYCGGGGDSDRLEYAVASEASQATESDREAAMTWLAAREDLKSWNVGALIDIGESGGL
jgi:uncharacterized protein YggL (DUF469 family)